MTRANLPPMDPAFVAATIEALPARLQKRLDNADPDSWTVETGTDSTTITVGSATVTLTPPDRAECGCLLSPRCLHLAQVLVNCPPTVAESSGPSGPSEPSESADTPLTLTRDQVSTLELAESCLTGILDRGLGGLTAGVARGGSCSRAQAAAAGRTVRGAAWAPRHRPARLRRQPHYAGRGFRTGRSRIGHPPAPPRP